MNVFNYINQYKKKSLGTYGELLNNKFSIEHELNENEKNAYLQLKTLDMQRFQITENRNLINSIRTSPHPVEVSGIGKVMQIC